MRVEEKKKKNWEKRKKISRTFYGRLQIVTLTTDNGGDNGTPSAEYYPRDSMKFVILSITRHVPRRPEGQVSIVVSGIESDAV